MLWAENAIGLSFYWTLYLWLGKHAFQLTGNLKYKSKAFGKAMRRCEEKINISLVDHNSYNCDKFKLAVFNMKHVLCCI